MKLFVLMVAIASNAWAQTSVTGNLDIDAAVYCAEKCKATDDPERVTCMEECVKGLESPCDDNNRNTTQDHRTRIGAQYSSFFSQSEKVFKDNHSIINPEYNVPVFLVIEKPAFQIKRVGEVSVHLKTHRSKWSHAYLPGGMGMKGAGVPVPGPNQNMPNPGASIPGMGMGGTGAPAGPGMVPAGHLPPSMIPKENGTALVVNVGAEIKRELLNNPHARLQVGAFGGVNYQQFKGTRDTFKLDPQKGSMELVQTPFDFKLFLPYMGLNAAVVCRSKNRLIEGTKINFGATKYITPNGTNFIDSFETGVSIPVGRGASKGAQ